MLRMADNLFFFGSSIYEVNEMMNEASNIIYTTGGAIKESSMSFMLAGTMRKQSHLIEVIAGDSILGVPQVFSFEALGAAIDPTANSEQFLEYRLLRADLVVGKHLVKLKASKSWAQRFRFWAQVVVPAAAFALGILHLGRQHLERAKRWENRWLRKVLKMRRSMAGSVLETMEDYNRRTDGMINDWFVKLGLQRIMHRMIDEYFRISTKTGTLSHALRQCRSFHWRTLVKAMPPKKRRTEGIQQARTGRRRDHETLMLEACDPDWAHKPEFISAKGKQVRRTFNSDVCNLYSLHIPFYSVRASKRSRVGFSNTERIQQKFVGSSFKVPFNLIASLNPPLPPLNAGDERWAVDVNQFEMVVDNFVLAELLNGRAAFQGSWTPALLTHLALSNNRLVF